MATAFNMPKPLQGYMEKNGYDRGTSKIVSQIVPVMLIQWFTVPLHLIAYDLYVHKADPGNLYESKTRTSADRMKFLRLKYMETVGARSARIFPAFGLGGLGNTYLRNRFLGRSQD